MKEYFKWKGNENNKTDIIKSTTSRTRVNIEN